MENQDKHELQQINTDIVLSGKDIESRREMMLEVCRNQFKTGIDYGCIPGTAKNIKVNGKWEKVEPRVLLQPGAEKFLSMFQVGVDPECEDLYDGFDHKYKIKVRFFSMLTGNTIGYSMGIASSKESKWAWKKAVCKEEYEEAPANRKRVIWKAIKNDKGYPVKDDEGNVVCEKIEQVRQYPEDQAETVLQMAIKRAMVKGVRTIFSCSDIFEQDIEEEHIRNAVMDDSKKTQTFQKPAAKPQQTANQNNNIFNQQPGCISEKQSKRLFAIIMGQIPPKNPNGYSKEYVDGWLQSLGIERYEQIPMDSYEEICNHIQDGTIPPPGA